MLLSSTEWSERVPSSRGVGDGTAIFCRETTLRIADEFKPANAWARAPIHPSARAVADLKRPWYNPAMSTGSYRIKTVERMTGIPAATLRAWEKRYGVVEPGRTDGGHRVYAERDIVHLQRLKRLVDDGLSIGEAVELAARPSSSRTADSGPLEAARDGLIEACVALNRPAAEMAVRPLVAVCSFPEIIRGVYIPALRGVGEHSRAAEQFGTALIREKIISMLSAIGPDSAPRRALLACPEGEQHELGLLCVALELSLQRWSVVYLGAGTALDTLLEAVEIVEPGVVCLSASRHGGLLEYVAALKGRDQRVVVGGHGAAGIRDEIIAEGGLYAATAADVTAALSGT